MRDVLRDLPAMLFLHSVHRQFLCAVPKRGAMPGRQRGLRTVPPDATMPVLRPGVPLRDLHAMRYTMRYAMCQRPGTSAVRVLPARDGAMCPMPPGAVLCTLHTLYALRHRLPVCGLRPGTSAMCMLPAGDGPVRAMPSGAVLRAMHGMHHGLPMYGLRPGATPVRVLPAGDGAMCHVHTMYSLYSLYSMHALHTMFALHAVHALRVERSERHLAGRPEAQAASGQLVWKGVPATGRPHQVQ